MTTWTQEVRRWLLNFCCSYGLVGTPTFSTRTKAPHQMVGYSAVNQSILLKMATSSYVGCESVRVECLA